MEYRPYDREQDTNAAHRIWRETGWIESDDDDKAMDVFLAGCKTLVADLNGEPECLVAALPGSIRYQNESLPFSAVAAVTTSRVARKQGLAGRLTASMIADERLAGAAVSGLGIFEQGYYNRLGYGNGSYEHTVRFDPAQLKVLGALDAPVRPPIRLSDQDWRDIHHALTQRKLYHGSCVLHSPEMIHGELLWSKGGFGLGYRDGEQGALSHFVWCRPNGEHGPYSVQYLVYQNRGQFHELLALLKSLGDQVHTMRIREPAGVQFQDLLEQPFKREQVSRGSDHPTGVHARAYWQVRICDLDACLAATHLPGDAIRFNLALTDPIVRYLPADAAWRGIGGDYIVTLGHESAASAGVDVSLPTLTASVGAFSRLWLGVRPASSLAMTDELDAPDELLDALDALLRLPAPHFDWDF